MLAAVTGATSGFGLAICRRFVADGGRVIAMGRRLERLVALQSELGATKCYIIQIDVRNRAATESWVSSLPDEFSAVDVLVNNAGLALGLEPANDANLDDWEVCVLGGVVCTSCRLTSIFVTLPLPMRISPPDDDQH